MRRSAGTAVAGPEVACTEEAQRAELVDAVESRDGPRLLDAVNGWGFSETDQAFVTALEAGQLYQKACENLADYLSECRQGGTVIRWKSMKNVADIAASWKFAEGDPLVRQARLLLKQWEAECKARATKHLEQTGGTATKKAFDHILKSYPPGFLERNFDIQDDAFALRHRNKNVVVRLRKSEASKEGVISRAAEGVFRRLVKQGGSGDLHDLTSRHSISKHQLLNFQGGAVFEIADGMLHLAGGARPVASAAEAAGIVTTVPGRRSTGDPEDRTSVITSNGAVLDDEKSEELFQLIEMYMVSEGDGVLDLRMIHEALQLKASPRLRRWFKRRGFHTSPNGEIWVEDERLSYYRIRRGLRVISRILKEEGNVASLKSLVNLIRRPPELPMLHGEEDGPPLLLDGEPSPGEAELALMPPEGEAEGALMPLEGEAEDDGSDAPLAVVSSGPFPLSTQHLELARKRVLGEPIWIEAWVRENFEVQDGIVRLPEIPSSVFERRRRRREALTSLDVNMPIPKTPEEEEALLMDISEELRLRYGRCSEAVICSTFRVKKSWLLRFFDVTASGDVLQKSVSRQTSDAVGVARCILESDGTYTDYEALVDFGVSKVWLGAFFEVKSDGTLGLDDHKVERIWKPAVMAPKAPNPYKYAILKDVPRGYLRKGMNTVESGTLKYARRRYGKTAGGLLF